MSSILWRAIPLILGLLPLVTTFPVAGSGTAPELSAPIRAEVSETTSADTSRTSAVLEWITVTPPTMSIACW